MRHQGSQKAQGCQSGNAKDGEISAFLQVLQTFILKILGDPKVNNS